MRCIEIKIILFFALAVFSDVSSSNELNLNYSYTPLDDSSPVVIGCQGMSLSLDNTFPNSCCIGNDCENVTEINLLQSDNQFNCPRLVIDGNIYPSSSAVSVNHSIELVDMASGGVSNCLSNGAVPTLGAGYFFISGFDSFGISDVYLNKEDWTVHLTSLDGNVVCNNSSPYDYGLVFMDGFE